MTIYNGRRRRPVSPYAAPRNFWIGVYFGPSAAFVQLLPMLGVRLGKPLRYPYPTKPSAKPTTRVYLDWRDCWVGVYVDLPALYVCPLPFVVIRVARRECRFCRAWAPWWSVARMCSVCSWRTSLGGSPRRPPAV